MKYIEKVETINLVKTLYDPIPITAYYNTVDTDIFGKTVKLVRNFVREDTNLNR